MASDEGFREIQLNGKQLVFLFMATTIIAVVIFLCGVMVGRGARNPRAAALEPGAAAAPAGDVTAVPEGQAAGKPAVPAPAAAAPLPPPPEEVTEAQPTEAGKQAAAPASNEAPAVPKTSAAASAGQKKATVPASALSAAPAAAAPAAVGASSIPTEPAGPGIAVQVAAYADQEQADTLARHLLDKGYAAYVVAPPPTGGMFRVRVGKYKERRQAEAVMRRLIKEEQLAPWIPPGR